MEKSIALFGTSADPPTIGHKKILEELSKIYAFTISYVSNNPKKKHIEDISIRSHLLKTLIDDLDNPKILFNQKISSQWAVESIKKCKEIYKFNNLDFVSSSKFRLNFNCSNLPSSLIDIVKKNNLYESIKLVE